MKKLMILALCVVSTLGYSKDLITKKELLLAYKGDFNVKHNA